MLLNLIVIPRWCSYSFYYLSGLLCMCVCVCVCVCVWDTWSFFCHQKAILFIKRLISRESLTLSSEVYLNISEQTDELKFCLRSSPLSVACSLLMASFNLFLRALFLARAPPTRLLVSTTASSLPVEKKPKEVQVGQRLGWGGVVKSLFQRKKFWFVPWKWSEVKVIVMSDSLRLHALYSLWNSPG